MTKTNERRKAGRPKITTSEREQQLRESQALARATCKRLGGISAADLADRIGASHATVRMWLNGKAIMTGLARRAVEDLK